VNAEFQAWVFVLGLACGAALAWLALGSGQIPDPDAGGTADDGGLEAEWIAGELGRRGVTADPATVAGTLALHDDLVHGRPLPPATPPAPSLPPAGPRGSGGSVRADEDRLPD
jgi:hypothetical protein